MSVAIKDWRLKPDGCVRRLHHRQGRRPRRHLRQRRDRQRRAACAELRGAGRTAGCGCACSISTSRASWCSALDGAEGCVDRDRRQPAGAAAAAQDLAPRSGDARRHRLPHAARTEAAVSLRMSGVRSRNCWRDIAIIESALPAHRPDCRRWRPAACRSRTSRAPSASPSTSPPATSRPRWKRISRRTPPVGLDELCLPQTDLLGDQRQVLVGPGPPLKPPPLAELKLGRSYRVRAVQRHAAPAPDPSARPYLPRAQLQQAATIVPHLADTVLVAPKERVEIAFIADNPGDWMMHCHIIEHQETGMMGYVRVA